jgi:hypothetical protein
VCEIKRWEGERPNGCKLHASRFKSVVSNGGECGRVMRGRGTGRVGVASFKFQVPGSRLQVPGFRFQISNLKFQISNSIDRIRTPLPGDG